MVTEKPNLMPPLYRQIRWWVLALLFCVTVINFVDRSALSVVAPILGKELNLNAQDLGFIFSAFAFGMMAGEFPMGWLMDKRGVGFGLSFAVLWWSIANGLHAFGRSRWDFGILRFLLGNGECGNFSGGVKVVSQWFPVKERAFAVGVFNSGSMIGSVIALPLIAFITARYGWHASFLLPSLMGLVWVIAWRAVYRLPEEHPAITAAELQYIQEDREPEVAPPPTGKLLAVPQTWALMLCRALVGPVVQFYIFWLPKYLSDEHHMTLTAIGYFAWVPYLFGDLGSIGGGWLSGLLIRRGLSVDVSRRAVMGLGAACCMASFAVAGSRSAIMAIAWICLVLFGHTALSANMFAVVSDYFPSNAVSRVTAMTGIAQGISGSLFPVLTGWLVQNVSYTPVFFIAALMPAAGCFILFAVGGRVRPLSL